MKKTNGAYVAIWYLGSYALLFALGVLGVMFKVFVLTAAALIGSVLPLVLLPGIMRRKMEKNALAMEKDFPQKGFSYHYKFTAHNAVFYIDTGGSLGVVWKNNPTELCFADLAGLADVYVHDGKQLGGTSLVSCQFKLEGKKYKIYTLRVSNGRLSMKSSKVLEAIAKAEELCEMLNTAKQAALSKNAAR